MVDVTKTYRATDPEFKRYGRLLSVPTDEIVVAAETLEMPDSGARYEPSLDVFERLSVTDVLRDEFFGELPIEIGCCWGHNRQLGALEWHASSEINIAATDFTLLLGKVDEMVDGTYHAADVKAFLIEKGQAVEIYATTLHFCPCTENAGGFRCVVALPKGTNLPLERTPIDPFLFRKNKWIVCHVDNDVLKQKGIKPGLYGHCHPSE